MQEAIGLCGFEDSCLRRSCQSCIKYERTHARCRISTPGCSDAARHKVHRATILCYMDALVVATSALHLVERPHTHLNLNILTVRVLHDCCAAVQLRL